MVTVANDGADVSGVLEWRFAGRPDEPTFQHAIDLPRGSRKRVTMDVFAHDLVRSGQLRLLEGGTVLVEQNQVLTGLDQERFLIGVVSSDPALLNSLNLLTLPGMGSATVRHLDIAMLPESAAALRGVNVLFFHDVDTTTLAPTQLDALNVWVQIGGQLVVSGGSSGQRTAAGLADLLPARVSGDVSPGDLTPLRPARRDRAANRRDHPERRAAPPAGRGPARRGGAALSLVSRGRRCHLYSIRYR